MVGFTLGIGNPVVVQIQGIWPAGHDGIMGREGVCSTVPGMARHHARVPEKAGTEFMVNRYVRLQKVPGHGKEDMLVLHGSGPLFYCFHAPLHFHEIKRRDLTCSGLMQDVT
ncbi:hypothetical protein [Komagataeibacter rhaeticus]|uniref:hypothetical protein n=1 Tax=Komagataeibacter rhaeticus TaxID=215221 RepID=UPI0039E7B3FF